MDRRARLARRRPAAHPVRPPRVPIVSEPPRDRQILTPGQLNAMARDLLEGSFPSVWVEGEISNLARPASGHLYLTLKDERAQVRCAMFRPKSQWLRFKPADGQRVLARGRLTLFEPRGDYQLVLDHIEEAGEGALRRAFDALQAKLAAEGLFDAARKRPLPRYLRRLGILTSPSGAAIRDVLSVLSRRFPLIEVEIMPVPVQGAAAAGEIAAMLRRAYAANRHDALLLTRGGGSLEDLWCFNDEALARLIAASPVPLVSAIGHEIDFTLADFAADLRAPTPSAAAELLAPDRAELLAVLAQQQRRLARAVERRLESLAQRVDRDWRGLRASSPQQRLARGRQRLDHLGHRLDLAGARTRQRAGDRLAPWLLRLRRVHPGLRLPQLAEHIAGLSVRLRSTEQRLRELREHRLTGLLRALEAVSPLGTLARGYAILRTDDGDLVRRAGQALPGQRLRARLVDGEIPLQVLPDGEN